MQNNSIASLWTLSNGQIICQFRVVNSLMLLLNCISWFRLRNSIAQTDTGLTKCTLSSKLIVIFIQWIRVALIFLSYSFKCIALRISSLWKEIIFIKKVYNFFTSSFRNELHIRQTAISISRERFFWKLYVNSPTANQSNVAEQRIIQTEPP